MIGRKLEQELLQEAVEKDRAQFVAVYGRRRVGKTFLVNEFFQNKYAFKHTAVSPVISVLVTTYGVERNEYSGRFQRVVTLEELFC